LTTAKPKIARFFRATQQRVWTSRQLQAVHAEMREEWQLSQRSRLTDFLNFLTTETPFVEIAINLPSKQFTRYWWKGPDVYDAVIIVNPKAYFSHHTALYFHNLIEDEPDIVYLNNEQESTGDVVGTMEQGAIDRTFLRPVRQSNCRTQYGDKTICVLSGKNTEQAGVINYKHGRDQPLRITNLERTLIDITVRPVYSGGVDVVSEAFKKAADRISIDKLISMLKRINHKYPYHQALGFYLERFAGFDRSALQPLRALGLKYDFYLDYQMQDIAYSADWRINYPKYLCP
jgi:hypothetical protein